MDVLPGNVNRWLRDKEARVRRERRVKEKRGKTLTQLIQWCLDQDLPSDLCPANSLQLNEFFLTPELLEAIHQCQRQAGQHSFREDLAGKTRLQQAQNSDQEDKQQGTRPLEHRVLIHLPQPLSGYGDIPIQSADIDQRTLDLTRFNRLIVVENADCFYQLAAFRLNPQPDDLIVYRGHNHQAKGCKALKQRWLETFGRNPAHPLIGFGDFDPAGLKIAISEGYQQLLLPPPDLLQQHASEQMNPPEQQRFLPALQRDSHRFSPPLQQILPILQQRGLRQQKMQGMRLESVNIFH